MTRRIEFYVDRIKAINELGNGKKLEVIVNTSFSESGLLRCIIFKEHVDLVQDWIGKPATFIVNLSAHESNGQFYNDIIIRNVIQHDVIPSLRALW